MIWLPVRVIAKFFWDSDCDGFMSDFEYFDMCYLSYIMLHISRLDKAVLVLSRRTTSNVHHFWIYYQDLGSRVLEKSIY